MKFIHEGGYAEQMDQEVIPYLTKRLKTGSFDPEGRGELYCESYRIAEPKAAIVIAHGFTETVEKYREVIYYLLQAGYNVYCYDMRGHGRSYRYTEDPYIVHIDNYETYVSDLEYFTENIAKKENEDLPLFLFGHSMGGGVSACLLEKRPDLFEKCVLNSPMIKPLTGGIPMPVCDIIARAKVKSGHATEYVTGHHAFTPDETFEKSAATSRERFDYYETKRFAELIYQNSGASYGWLKEAIRLSRSVIKPSEIQKIRTRTMLFIADNDEFVDKKAQMLFSERCPYVTPVFSPDTKHEIYMSRDEEMRAYLNKMLTFLQKPLEIKGKQ